MIRPNPAALVLGAAILLVTVELLRRRSLREKYAALWLAISVATVALAVAPGVLVVLAHTLGFTVPANLLFFVGTLVLTFISMQLSLELGRLDDNSQRLAEEVALLRLELRTLQDQLADAGSLRRPNGRTDVRPAEESVPGSPAGRSQR